MNVKRIFYNFVEAYMEHSSKPLKLYGKEYESNFIDFRDEDEDEKQK